MKKKYLYIGILIVFTCLVIFWTKDNYYDNEFKVDVDEKVVMSTWNGRIPGTKWANYFYDFSNDNLSTYNGTYISSGILRSEEVDKVAKANLALFTLVPSYYLAKNGKYLIFTDVTKARILGLFPFDLWGTSIYVLRLSDGAIKQILVSFGNNLYSDGIIGTIK